VSEIPLELGPQEAAQLLAGPNPPLLLDVREPMEHAHVKIEGSKLIPMNDLPARVSELDKDAPLIAYCHHGVRSMHVVRWLRANGFGHAQSLAGGIDAWSAVVDPSLRRY
jgi:rhodanese-related sulfurtransferase